MRPYVEDFTPEKAANASAAAEGMCKWVCAMDKYEAGPAFVPPKLLASNKFYSAQVELKWMDTQDIPL